MDRDREPTTEAQKLAPLYQRGYVDGFEGCESSMVPRAFSDGVASTEREIERLQAVIRAQNDEQNTTLAEITAEMARTHQALDTVLGQETPQPPLPERVARLAAERGELRAALTEIAMLADQLSVRLGQRIPLLALTTDQVCNRAIEALGLTRPEWLAQQAARSQSTEEAKDGAS